MIKPVVFETSEELARTACKRVLSIATQSILHRGYFAIALAGGSTPQHLYELLANSGTDFSKWRFFFGDERHVPPDHEQSNFCMARRTLFDPAGVLESQIYRMETAEAYEETIKTLNPIFDLILLGIGSDGHTASLFPGLPAVEETGKLVVATKHGILPPHVDRITFTLPLINAARNVLFLVRGTDKASIVQAIVAGNKENYPAGRVNPVGQLVWMIDRAAGSKGG